MVQQVFNDKIRMVSVDEIQPSPTNANQHDEKQLAAITDSIVHFGWTYPLLITSDTMIVAGHGRFEAAKRLGMTEVPCVQIPDWWTPDDIRAYMLADNSIQKRSTWNEQLLSLELHDLHSNGYDMGLTGFTPEDLSTFMGYDEPMMPDDVDYSGTGDSTPSDRIECPRCGYKFKGK